MRHVVIMAGGSGKRLWPLSRQGEPKQLLPLVDGKSLLRVAYERIAGLVPDAQVLICTGAAYLDTVADQLPELPPENLLGEPEGRDSLNAVAWSAAVIERRSPGATVAMLSSDQIMSPVTVFRDAVELAFKIAETDAGALVTFGVVPSYAATRFGYLRRGPELEGHAGVHRVLQFAEKPSAEVAQRYVDSGEYWWNAGMFCWRTQTLLDALQVVLPKTHAAVTELAVHPERITQIYPALHKISIDYAVMEPASRGDAPGHVVAVPLPIEWYDVGSFLALSEHLPTDGERNARQGITVALDSSDNLLVNARGDGSVLAVAGLRGTAVIATPRATMVVPLDQSERVKDLVALVSEQVGDHLA